jgi:methylated-DNA-protein-cysteine methyltransferase-like protein
MECHSRGSRRCTAACYTAAVTFSNPPDPKAYNARVYELVRAIPAGRVATYGQIARLIPPVEGLDAGAYLRLSPRWVGSAMAACPDDVPWQRVINSQGKVSPRPGFGVLVQRKLLEEEAVSFDARERVDLERYGWEPNSGWLRAHGFIAWEEGGEEAAQPPLF